jgi:hypothetical protein
MREMDRHHMESVLLVTFYVLGPTLDDVPSSCHYMRRDDNPSVYHSLLVVAALAGGPDVVYR